MSRFYLLMVFLSVLWALWLAFRRHSDNPRGRLLTVTVGLAIAALALYQGLHGQSPLMSRQAIAPSSEFAMSPSAGVVVLTEAIRLFLIMVVASLGVFAFCIARFALKGGMGVLHTRGPIILGWVCCVGAYFYISLLPMGLVKLDAFHFADQTVDEIAVAYMAWIAALIFAATVLALRRDVRCHKPIVAGFFIGCMVAAASSPFVWTVSATTMPAAQPIAVLGIFAMVAPAPGYFLLHYRLGWL